MSFSIYYEAKRKHQITEHEKSLCKEIVERFTSQCFFDEKVEDFCVYKLDENTNIIFSGATKLPDSDVRLMFDVANYWLKCLTEITHILPNSEWHIHWDDVDLIWDEDEGWRFPTDEKICNNIKLFLDSI